MPKHFYSILYLIVFSCFPSFLPGSGTRVDYVDAFAVGRGNAFSATADNPSALYYNPAGMTQLEGFQVRAGIFFISLDYTATIAGQRYAMDDSYQALPNFFATWEWEGDLPLWLGLGVYVPFGLATDWPANSPFFAVADRSELEYLTIQPTVAWKVNDQLSIGAGPTINRARLTFDQALTGFFYSGKDTSLGLALSLLWTPQPQHAFALVHRRYSRSQFEGALELPVAPGVTMPTRGQAEFPFPEAWRGGYSFRPNDSWNLEINVEVNRWNVLDTVILENAISPVPFQFDWESSRFYEFGVTRYWDNGFHLSGGIAIVENSVPERTFTPVVPDSDRTFYSLGAGGKGERWSWDVAVQYGTGSRQVSQPPGVPPGFSFAGNYKTVSRAVSASLSHQF